MKLREIFVGGFWLASLVEVFGFTYEAFQQTYTQFPIGGSGSAASAQAQLQDAAASASPGAEKILRGLGIGSNGPFYTLVRRISGFLGIAGSTPQTGTYQVPNLNALLAAIRAGNRGAALNYYQAAVRALDKHPAFGGHADVGVALQLRQNGLYREFSALTGVRVSGF